MSEVSSRSTRFGLTLPNRGVLTGVTTIAEILHLSQLAEDHFAWDSVWVGDSIFAKPRLDALVLLGGLALRTERVKLGVACMASTPLRDALLLAYQWASLDFVANGRTIFVACQGAPGASGGSFEEEFAAFGIDPGTRMRRMEEAIAILRLTSAEEQVTYRGEYNRFANVTVLPRPVQQPVPIWVTANPDPSKPKMAERALRRVAVLGDGWMTTRNTPASFAQNLASIQRYAREEGRELGAGFEACLYYNINVNEDRVAAFVESKRFLDAYYGADYDRAFIEGWVAFGSPQECIDHLRAFVDAGATTITLRLTGYDQEHQFDRVTREVLPAFGAAEGGRG
jgi:alkanesulfonate monooxygenase SsuD/methylene tetrahydromethanopterin reductase-like flavin-dependent oxidoreductase (luciferase family)